MIDIDLPVTGEELTQWTLVYTGMSVSYYQMLLSKHNIFVDRGTAATKYIKILSLLKRWIDQVKAEYPGCVVYKHSHLMAFDVYVNGIYVLTDFLHESRIRILVESGVKVFEPK